MSQVTATTDGTTVTPMDRNPREYCANCGRILESTGHRCPLPLDASATAATYQPIALAWESITKSGGDN